MARAETLGGRFRSLFEGSAPTLPLALARIALALIVLFRTTDLGSSVFHANHHTWMSGIEYAPYVDHAQAPSLESPLVPGFALSVTMTWLLVVLRTVAAVTLLLGLRVRWSALAVAISGFWLMFADRYRYLHHLFLLFEMCAWFALVPSAERLSLERWLSGRSGTSRVPRYSLQLMRLLAVSVYLAAGVAKLRADWLSGETLAELERVTLIGGKAYGFGVTLLGHAGVARGICALELALGPLLLWPRTRRPAVLLGALLHASVMASMEVSTFNAQMWLLLALFLVRDDAVASPPGAPRLSDISPAPASPSASGTK